MLHLALTMPLFLGWALMLQVPEELSFVLRLRVFPLVPRAVVSASMPDATRVCFLSCNSCHSRPSHLRFLCGNFHPLTHMQFEDMGAPFASPLQYWFAGFSGCAERLKRILSSFPGFREAESLRSSDKGCGSLAFMSLNCTCFCRAPEAGCVVHHDVAKQVERVLVTTMSPYCTTPSIARLTRSFGVVQTKAIEFTRLLLYTTW